jgi:glucose-1-phosphate cytidylyltransferase
MGDLSIDLGLGAVHRHNYLGEDWVLHFVDMGLETNTGGRIRRLLPWLGTSPFLLTYGDGVSNVDLNELVRFHESRECLATVTAVWPPARFGGIALDGDRVSQFTEKPQIGEGWINGGFMVCEPGVFRYLNDDAIRLERDLLAQEGLLAAYRHHDFWQCMDTLCDKRLLDQPLGNPTKTRLHVG